MNGILKKRRSRIRNATIIGFCLAMTIVVLSGATGLLTFANDSCSIYCSWFGTTGQTGVNISTLSCKFVNSDNYTVACSFVLNNPTHHKLSLRNATLLRGNSSLPVLPESSFFLRHSATEKLTLTSQPPPGMNITSDTPLSFSLWFSNGQQISGSVLVE
jgi:hypothetical protein